MRCSTIAAPAGIGHLIRRDVREALACSYSSEALPVPALHFSTGASWPNFGSLAMTLIGESLRASQHADPANH
jgi:hypothetical protein